MTTSTHQFVSPRFSFGYDKPSPAATPAARNPMPRIAQQHALRERLADDIRKVAAGNLDAFERVYQVTSSKLFGVILRVVGRQDVAEEILQDTYLILWTRAALFDHTKASPITWLAAIARNRAIDTVRRRQPVFMEDTPGVLEFPSGENIAAAYEDLEAERRLLDALSKLPPMRRTLLQRVYFDGKSRVDLAVEFDCTASKIRNELRSALAELKQHLDAPVDRAPKVNRR